MYSLVFSQGTAFGYLNNSPALPLNICEMKSAEKKAYLDKVDKFSDQLDADIAQRNKEAKELLKQNEDEIRSGAARQAGFSDADIAKMKNSKNMTKAEKDAMIDQMLQKQANISMGEIKNMQNMSEAGKKAWAESYATEAMANAQANPKQFQAEQKKNLSMYELATEQQNLIQKRMAGEAKFDQQLDSLQKDAFVAMGPLKEEIKPIEEERSTVNDGEGATSADAARIRALQQQIYNLQDAYCAKFTPRYVAIVQEYRLFVERTIPDINMLEEIQNELTKAQTGFATPIARPGTMALGGITKYIDLLQGAFKYKLYVLDE
jgi:hypothetical protein